MATTTTRPTTTIPANPPFARGSLIWQKRGPLPVWAWMLIGLLGLLVFTWWRRNRTAAASGKGEIPVVPGSQQQTPVFIVQPTPATPPHCPPGGGRPAPPAANPGSPFPPPPETVSTVGGQTSDPWINDMTARYGLYWNQIAAIYVDDAGQSIGTNVKGGGPTATWKQSKSFHRVGNP